MDAGETQTAPVDWGPADLPVSRRFADSYFSADDGLAEAIHVFVAGNDLPARFRPGFAVAELGFGTGLTAIAAARAWDTAALPGRLAYTSFEAFPLAAADMARALARWPELRRWTQPLLDAWRQGERRLRLGGIDLVVVEGDAPATLPAWPGQADAWLLDGFSPARNPELWEPGLLAEVAARTAPGGSFATDSAAGAVRRSLTAAGFTVHPTPGHGRKRHMNRGSR